jgi:hypothetical protein
MAVSPAWLAAAASVENPALIWACYALALVFFAIAWVALFWARVTSWVEGRPGFGRIREPENQQPVAPVNEDLRQRSCKLSAELFEFYKHQRENIEQAMQSAYMDSLYNDPVGEQKRSEIAAYYDRQIISQYSEHLGSKVLDLSGKLAQRKYITSRDQDRFENPEKSQDIQYIAQRLEAICHSR